MKSEKSIPSSSAEKTVQEIALQRFRPLLSEKEFEALILELQRPLPPAIRVNMLKVDPMKAIAEWSTRYNWQSCPVPFCPTGWWVENSSIAISEPVEHRTGFYYIQDAASMLPGMLLDIEPSKRPLILDMAASPGGKTTHLVDRCADLGLVIANDSSRERITALRLVLQNWGAMNVVVTCFPGEMFGQWFPESFDGVLLDAPCSMQSLRSSESRRVRPISARERGALAQRQVKMLQSALQAVKIGGSVVYSTCTLEAEEDESVLDTVLGTYGAAIRIEDVTDCLPHAAPGLEMAEIDGNIHHFSRAVRNAARLWPHTFGTSGFFAARLRKTSAIPSAYTPSPRDVQAESGLQRLTGQAESQLQDELLQNYGFDFFHVLNRQEVALWQRRHVYYAIPEAWHSHFGHLPFQALGMRIAERQGKDLVPSHEWMLRFGSQFQKGIYLLPDEALAMWMKGYDIRMDTSLSDLPSAVVLVKDRLGRLYGRGKLVSGRLRNMLPGRIVHV